MVTDTTTGLFDIVRRDSFFNCFIPIGVVSHERSGGCFYLFKCFVELCRKPTGWTVKATKDFVVVVRGDVEIAVDVMGGGCVDVTVVHTGTRMREGG